MTNYWFYLEPYVFLWQKKEEILLYNTFNGETIKFDNSGVLKELALKLLTPENMYCIPITSFDLNNKAINTFVSKVRSTFSGDIQECSGFSIKPIIMYPKLNYQQDIKRIRQHQYLSEGENILRHLSEISFHITENCNNKCAHCETNYKQTSFCTNSPNSLSKTSFLRQFDRGNVGKVNIIGNDISKCNDIINSLRSSLIKYNITFHIHYLNLNPHDTQLAYLEENNISLKILVNLPINTPQLDQVIKLIKTRKGNYSWLFTITSLDDFHFVKSIQSKYELSNAELKPIFTGNNLTFFEDNIFMNKEDILGSKQAKKVIFAKQVLNTFDYGKITVMQDGKVYANINNPELGNIHTPIKELLFNEITKGVSWHRIRNQDKCESCVYQWICPSPSNYEYVIGKQNLCHIKR